MRGMGEHQRLERNLVARHQPIQRVLETTGYAMGIFRAGNDEAIGPADLPRKFQNDGWRFLALIVRIEDRYFADQVADLNGDASRTGKPQRIKQPAAGRGPPLAAAKRVKGNRPLDHT